MEPSDKNASSRHARRLRETGSVQELLEKFGSITEHEASSHDLPAGWGGERTVYGVLKAFRSVHSAPQPLPSRLWTA